MAKAVKHVQATPMYVFQEPSEEVQRKQAVLRAMRDIVGYGFGEDDEAWQLTEKVLDVADNGKDVDTELVDALKGTYSAEVIAAVLDRLRDCPEFRELAYGDPAPEGFVGRVDWNRMGANADTMPY